MKIFVQITLLISLCFVTTQLYALPDSEIQKLVASSPNFAKAEQRILDVWKNLPKDFRSQIRNEQVEWIKNGRDREANKLINNGASTADAYAQVTNDRSDYLLRKSNPNVSLPKSSVNERTSSPPPRKSDIERTGSGKQGAQKPNADKGGTGQPSQGRPSKQDESLHSTYMTILF
jgi:hypothetical protein